jgi:hypothetical protein
MHIATRSAAADLPGSESTGNPGGTGGEFAVVGNKRLALVERGRFGGAARGARQPFGRIHLPRPSATTPPAALTSKCVIPVSCLLAMPISPQSKIRHR